MSWALPSGTAQGTLEQRVAALEAKLAKLTFDAATNELVITGANLRIVNGVGQTDCPLDPFGNPVPGCPNGLGNLIVGYNEPRGGDGDVRTGSHNVVVGRLLNFSRFGGIVVGEFNDISGPFAAVTGGFRNTASGERSSVSGGTGNMASGGECWIGGGENNLASGIESSISGGKDLTQDTAHGWAAGSLGDEIPGRFRSP